MLVLLNFVFPEFCISFVSFPAKITTPYAHSVFRSTVPVGDIDWLQCVSLYRQITKLGIVEDETTQV